MKEIFLESHNLRNLYSGLGQYNYFLINSLLQQNPSDIRFTVNVPKISQFKKVWKDSVRYHQYYGFSRYAAFRPKVKTDLWHSLNQNTKIEPFYNNTPYLMTVHDVNFIEEVSSDPNHPVNLSFIKKLNRSNALIYISEFAKKSTHQNFKVPSIPEFVVYNGNPVAEEKIVKNHSPQFLPQFPYIFSIGEFREKKNFHTLVEMLPFLDDEIHLILAGKPLSPYIEKVQESIRRLQLENRVHLLGKISEQDKLYYYKNAYAFGFPSLREGFGIPPIEAMSFGIPIFLSDRTSLPEIGGKFAFYWENFEPEYMANVFQEGMQKYGENPSFYQKAYKERAKSFSWDNTAREYIEIYRSILET